MLLAISQFAGKTEKIIKNLIVIVFPPSRLFQNKTFAITQEYYYEKMNENIPNITFCMIKYYVLQINHKPLYITGV